MSNEDWKKSIEYAIGVCSALQKQGIKAEVVPYIMPIGKGLHIEVYDAFGIFFKEYASGIKKNFKEMMLSLDYNAMRIKTEYRALY